MKRLCLALLGLVVLAVAAFLLFPARGPLAPLLSFPAGDSASLRGLSYGTRHPAPAAQGWLRLLPVFARAWLSGLSRGANPSFRDVVTAEPSLVLWIENTACGTPPSGPTGRTWLMIADETGHVAGSRVAYPGRYWARKSTVAFASWPRSSRKLTVRWFEEGESEAGELVGEWVIGNPAYQPPARWPDEPLPHTLTNGPLRCTLERVLFGLSREVGRSIEANSRRLHFDVAGPGEGPAVVLVPRFTADSPEAPWVVGSVTLRDSSGNEVRREPFWLAVEETCCYFTPALWPADTWELKLSAKRAVPFQLPVPEWFAPGELLVFTEVDVTGAASATLNQAQERGGARVQLTQFTLRPPKDLNEPWDAAEVSELRATLWRSTSEIVHVDLAGVMDDHGKAHYPRAHGFSATSRADELGLHYHFPTLPVDTRRVAITFVLQRGRDFTFHVKPEIARSTVSLP
jgi:hypothetical protein